MIGKKVQDKFSRDTVPFRAQIPFMNNVSYKTNREYSD
jgi:hypothetical protein